MKQKKQRMALTLSELDALLTDAAGISEVGRLTYTYNDTYQEPHALMEETYEGGRLNVFAYKPRTRTGEAIAARVNLYPRLLDALLRIADDLSRSQRKTKRPRG